MNFFRYQDQARRTTRWLLVLFTLAVLGIVAVVDLALLFLFGEGRDSAAGTLPVFPPLEPNFALLAWGAVATVGVIAVGSLFRTARLSAGGGQVARELGGTQVDTTTRDPLQRRLVNVVEEIAIASGLPVPEIYVLEREPGINAFAAGFSASDAAIAVTQGALERLSRSELQAVIAHEFSHVFNGDMRLNIRLIGVLFGILMVGLIGRRVLGGMRYSSRSRNSNAGAVLVLALVVMAVGYIGLFFGRWIKAAVSRQREYLADASAVQFTRDAEAMAGALKTIAVHAPGSHLRADSEEVGHMLFGEGRQSMLFDTHPPLMRRIQRIEPSFDKAGLAEHAQQVTRREARRRELAEQEEQARRTAAERAAGAGGFADVDAWMERIGQPDFAGLLAAAAAAFSVPSRVARALHSPAWAPEVLLWLLLDADAELRERQLLVVAQRLGEESERQVRLLLQEGGLPAAEQRLPILEMAFPALKRRPAEQLVDLVKTINELIDIDGRVEPLEYLLGRIVTRLLWESANPRRVRSSGRRGIRDALEDARVVLTVLARHGHQDAAAARAAFRAGWSALEVPAEGEPADVPAANWAVALDRALERLDRLAPSDKERFVRAAVATVVHDGVMASSELELLRAVTALVHVPLPLPVPGTDTTAS